MQRRAHAACLTSETNTPSPQKSSPLPRVIWMIGKYAWRAILVDEEDFPLVSQYRWFGHRKSGKVYPTALALDGSGEELPLHRFLMHPPADLVVDHIDGDALNNTRSNLRICTQKENSRNRGKPAGIYKSKYKGVSWHKQRNRWCAYICCDGRTKSLGTYNVEEDAARAYNEAAIRLHGGFAHLNQIS